jgi:serine/threonine-protein kinase
MLFTTASGYLVMELLEGTSLAEELKRSGKLPLARVLDIMIPVCEVLVEAHARGVIHRDVKPANIFLHSTRVKVVDFGIARLEDEWFRPKRRSTSSDLRLGSRQKRRARGAVSRGGERTSMCSSEANNRRGSVRG